jgi:hypothetical protein
MNPNTVDNLQQFADTAAKTKSIVTWHDLTIGLWALVAAAGFALGKFIKWFSTREVKRFWEDVDGRLKQQLSAHMVEHDATLYAYVDKKLHEIQDDITKSIKVSVQESVKQSTIDITDIKDSVKKLRAHNHDRSAVERGVFEQLLDRTDKLDQIYDYVQEQQKAPK